MTKNEDIEPDTTTALIAASVAMIRKLIEQGEDVADLLCFFEGEAHTDMVEALDRAGLLG